MKYLGKEPFSVMGEGSKQALDAYRKNWEKIFGKKGGK